MLSRWVPFSSTAVPPLVPPQGCRRPGSLMLGAHEQLRRSHQPEAPSCHRAGSARELHAASGYRWVIRFPVLPSPAEGSHTHRFVIFQCRRSEALQSCAGRAALLWGGILWGEPVSLPLPASERPPLPVFTVSRVAAFTPPSDSDPGCLFHWWSRGRAAAFLFWCFGAYRGDSA